MSEGRIPCVVLVDDDEANRYAVARILRSAGLTVWEAGRGREALALAEEIPDLIILDVNLPDMDGMEVCRRIKSSQRTSCIPVLHLTASKIQSRHRVQGLDAGADGYLIQPVEPEELIATVQALLRARSAEDALRRSTREWSTTFDALSDAISLIRADGTVLRCNRAMLELMGEAHLPAAGRAFAELPGGLGLFGTPVFERAIETRMRQTAEGRLGERWFRLAADPVLDDDGRVTAVVQILTDVTDIKELEEAARQRADALSAAARAKDEFLAMLGHELRNPLAAISNALHILNQIGSQAEPAKRQRTLLRRQVGHLTRMVDDLLDVSRITRGKIELRLERFDLRPLVQSAVQSSLPQMETNGQHFELYMPDVPVMINADATRVEQVVTNLLNNAAKYTDAGGSIRLVVETSPDPVPGKDPFSGSAFIRVIDTGIGIAPEMLPRIFDLFAQVDQTLDRTRGGLGIGLTLVRNLVEMHGGVIGASSPGPGRGSTFTVRLPMLHSSPEGEGRPAAEASGGVLRIGKRREVQRVLVVEDQGDARETLCDLLELWGFAVESAADGHAGVECMRTFCPDVALVDIGLPGLNGYEVAQTVRALPELADVRLIALTGYGQEEDRRRAKEAGFDAHLTKPVDPEELRPLLGS